MQEKNENMKDVVPVILWIYTLLIRLEEVFLHTEFLFFQVLSTLCTLLRGCIQLCLPSKAR